MVVESPTQVQSVMSITKAILLTIGLFAASNLAAQGIIRPVKDTTLENGLQIIVFQNPAAPVVTAEIVVKTGAFTQATPQEEGLPHLLEHVLFRSGSGISGASFGSHASELEGSYNGVTDSEHVRYYLSVPPRNFARALTLLSELVRSPDLSPESIELEKKIVRGEMERKASEAQFLLQVESGRLLWGERGWARKNPGGNLISILNATPQRLTDHYRRYYVPNNSALVISGNVTPKEAIDAAARTFRGWRRGPDPLTALPEPTVDALTANRNRMIPAAEIYDVTFLVRWQGPSVGKDTTGSVAGELFSQLVNQPLSGTQKRLVETGIFQSVNMRHDTKNYTGSVDILAVTTLDKAVAAASALSAEMARLAAPDYFSDADMQLGRKKIQVGSAGIGESAEAVAHLISDVWASAGLKYMRDFLPSIEARSAADVRRFVETYIRGKNMSVSVLLSNNAMRSIGPQLNPILAAWGTR